VIIRISRIAIINEHLVEETLNQILDAEASRICNTQKWERSSKRKDSRAGRDKKGFDTKAGRVKLKMPKLRNSTFETAIIEIQRPVGRQDQKAGHESDN